jgi:general secretion pathway protein E
MGVEPYLLSSSLIGVIAQRLVRLLCENCKVPHQPTAQEAAILGVSLDEAPMIYHGGACQKCNQSGYVGRNGIYELIEVSDEARNLIHEGASEIALERLARKTSPSIRHDGARLILAGKTSMEEVLRVTREELKE